MWNEPTKEELDRLPRLYQTEDLPLAEKLIQMHFFLGGCDWWIAEFDGEDLFFGYAVLNGDWQLAEWGYISLSELKSIKVGPGIEVDRDLFWEPKPAKDIPAIASSLGKPVGSDPIRTDNQQAGQEVTR